MFVEHPTRMFSRSVRSHNCDEIVAADWVELSVLMFDEGEEGLTSPELSDYLIESQLYASQDFCAEFVETLFSELGVRQQIAGDAYPLRFDSNRRLCRTEDWESTAALSFCLALSVLPHYSGYTDWVDHDYVDQGTLFEDVSVAALRVWLPEWTVVRTGWGGGSGTPLADLLEDIAGHTLESVRTEAPDFVSASEKDLGLDIAAVRLFHDGRPAVPAIFGQCASGLDWHTKLATPDASRWKQLLTLTHTPLRAFTFPFRLSELQYPSRRSQYKGVLMDRLRLIPRLHEREWIDQDLQLRLIEWLSPRRAWLADNYPSGLLAA